MTAKTTNVFMREDTIFGVCQAIGEDLGFNPMWLRIPLAVPVVIAPWYSVGAYAVLAVAVIASRLAFPVRQRKSAEVVEFHPAPAATSANVEEAPLQLAA